jgi:HSP20 family protein
MSELFVEIEKQVSRIGKEFQAAMDRFQHEGEQLDSFRLRADVLETGSDIQVFIDLPGLTRDQVQLSVANGVLTVKGERKIDTPEQTAFSKRERYFGQFYRSFPLPENASPKEISARLTNGVLEVRIPKTGTASGEIPIG